MDNQQATYADEELEQLTKLVVEQERAAAHEDMLLRTIFEDSPIGIALVSSDGTFTKVNKNFAWIAGWPREELIGKKFSEITHPDDLAEDAALAAHVVSGRLGHYVMEKRYIAKDGSTRWIVLSVSGVVDKGEFITFVSHIQDTTKLRGLLSDKIKRAEAGNAREQ